MLLKSAEMGVRRKGSKHGDRVYLDWEWRLPVSLLDVVYHLYAPIMRHCTGAEIRDILVFLAVYRVVHPQLACVVLSLWQMAGNLP